MGLCEGGLVAHRGEQLACRDERLLGSGIADGGEAAALAEECVCAFRNVAELVPTAGRIGIERDRFTVVARCLGELCPACREGVLLEGDEVWDAVRKAGGEPGSSRASAVRTRPGKSVA